MADSTTYGPSGVSSSRAASQRSQASASSSGPKSRSSETSEQTPLLSPERRSEEYDAEDQHRPRAATSLLRSLTGRDPSEAGLKLKRSRRWPSTWALVILCIAVCAIMLMGFIIPETVEQYALQAAVFEPGKISLADFTDTGIRVHVEGIFRMDASRVKKKAVRGIGRFATWIAREAETGPTQVHVYLPEYGNAPLVQASIPGVKVGIRNGHANNISMVVDVAPGSFKDLREVVEDYLEKRLSHISLQGKTKVAIRSGIIHLGEQVVEHTFDLKGGGLPSLPSYNISRLNFHEDTDGKGMGADVTVLVHNDYSIGVTIPPISADILVDNCAPADPYIKLGSAVTGPIRVEPSLDVVVNATGQVERLPAELTAACPKSTKSPLDTFLGDYIRGQDATVYVQCCSFPDPQTPSWARDLDVDFVVPVPLHGKTFDNIIRNFSLTDTHFDLPDLLAEPDSPEARPRISAKTKVLVGLPKEMNFAVDVTRVRADTELMYKGSKFGKLDLSHWQKANSTKIEGNDAEGLALLVESTVHKAPLIITDEEVFGEVVQALMFGSDKVLLTVQAEVDVDMKTPLGQFVIRQIPAEGTVPVKPPTVGGGLKKLHHQVGNLRVVNTTETSVVFQAEVNFTNPTSYGASIPYADIHILHNGTVLGHAILKNAQIVPGNNTNILAQVLWDPREVGGDAGSVVGRELLSQYISGYNTTLTLKPHAESIPSFPAVGKALQNYNITVPFPRLGGPQGPPGHPGDGGTSHFIQETTMHLLTSTAVFTLFSPFTETTLFLTYMNATAYYHSHPAGRILYDQAFPIPPGLSESPRLPVDWHLDSLGYEAIKKALGGSLKLDARAECGIRIGRWTEDVWMHAKGIGAKVRL